MLDWIVSARSMSGHHLPHNDVALAVQQLKAHFRQIQGFFGADEIALCGKHLIGHSAVTFPVGLLED